MKQSTLNRLTKDSTFYDSESFKYFVSKVYKDKNGVNGVLASCTWKNDYGSFSERKYLPREELLTEEYDDEFVDIEENTMAETEMVEVMIKMPKEKYDSICNMYETFSAEMKKWGLEYIKNGTVLPEGHGRLIDADEIQFENAEFDTYGDYCRAFDAIDQADTIIGADTQNKEKEDIMPYITGATLLSASEAKNLDKEILKADKDWWLGSRGNNDYFAACVIGDTGYVYGPGDRVDFSFGVRPALIISDLESFGYKTGESVHFGGHSFTIISDRYALCNDIIGECAFRKDSKAENANEYEISDIKRYVETWFEKVKEQSREGRDSEEEREI